MSRSVPMERASLHARLRAATDPAHRALEAGLDWRARVATMPGYRGLLGRLYGFHAVWEPAIATALADESFLAPRRRLAQLAADLGHLGVGPGAVAAFPQPDAPILAGPAAATGALYVLEGSTLGGQLIGRHIAGLHGFGEIGDSGFDWDFNAAFQWGDRAGSRHRAWALHAELGKSFEHPWKPRLAAWLNYATGDDGPGGQ